MANNTNNHCGHRQRVKDRFRKEKSFDSFAPHNILEYLLFFSIPQGDTNDLAHTLIEHFGSLHAVLEAPPEQLVKVKGIGEHTADLISMILPLSRAYANSKNSTGIILDTTEKQIDFLLARYLGYTSEVFSIACLDNRNNLLSYHIISKGAKDSVAIDIRSVIEILMRTGASAMIMAHNHPGGFALPSTYDVVATRQMIKACSNIGIVMKDHFIISAGECISMRESGEYQYLFRKVIEYEEN